MAPCAVAIVGPSPERILRWRDGLDRCAKEAGESALDFLAHPIDALSHVLALPALKSLVIDTRDCSFELVMDALRSAQVRSADLDIFLMGPAAPDAPRQQLLNGWLDSDLQTIPQAYTRLKSALDERAETPFADALRQYVAQVPKSWHTPGHAGGNSLRNSRWGRDFYEAMGAHSFESDLSVSVRCLDSLLEPTAVIQRAQALAARAFGSRETYFVTNGTSTANKVVIQHVMTGGGKMLVDRNCHKSVHHAAILCGATPVYLQPAVNEKYGIYGPVPRKVLLAAIAQNPDARLLVLTSCTYDGLRYDLPQIVAAAHARGIRVLIDEAWYAHGRFHPELRPTALDAGADFVTQSTHKTLSAYSQASMVHIGSDNLDRARFRNDINMYASTSPQYGIIASLDVARMQMEMEGYGLLDRAISLANGIRARLDGNGPVRALGLDELLPAEIRDDGIRLDPTKITIDLSALPVSGTEFERRLFESHNIQVEKSTGNAVTALATIAIDEERADAFCTAVESLANSLYNGKPAATGCARLPQLSEQVMTPREAYFGVRERAPLTLDDGTPNTGLIGRIAADEVVPYPPGIPVLVPGQRISEEILHFICGAIEESGLEMHGISRENGARVSVVADTGEKFVSRDKK
ncbi:aminotransferase class I/II-fold pyridoxal phosphate-dependent enzyme [Biformimicrobium ophioploci]|uniref:Orn/Lys/Arg decarboxylases family 1 pyridoxal-P attachment site domain-containing protein n=1 Tax=Biformimicrobium ophioploci TaxID=3036711 RepID=A0ABQ6M0Q7_9GAMM|nr:aminotransferase class V-fold PLP-dependent enzyme [Microbulbifer sp. NKW57]GMG87917.1 hypothetical protein MNKW57_22380 [Microbulbifer sp. NKW57]